ncbi:hypothetical protein TPB0596_12640 [Tsukamurella pulmonis]|uniref:hypothetical protein n=1 Tax=Tsukamurella pulmonis TaxID=47312 RepID=UPI001EDF758A|nr:hypothetical protein [Tsukamurella pulmonis]BDD81501.1 hypothetical protein TPB0596_12640 [Tsukamurella pulmonis]
MRRLLPPVGGARATILVALGWIAITRALGYAPWAANGVPSSLGLIESLAPLWVWATIWGAAGVGVIGSLWLPRVLPFSIGAMVFLHAAWTMSCLGTMAFDATSPPRLWVSAAYYAGTAAVAFGAGMLRDHGPITGPIPVRPGGAR